MTPLAVRTFETPAESGLGLRRSTNLSGLAISVVPNGCLFAIEHRHERGRTLINQVQGSPLEGGIARLYLRIGGAKPTVAQTADAVSVLPASPITSQPCPAPRRRPV